MTDKPLFVPLCAEFYDDFIKLKKNTEYRLHGPRWNSKTCYPERQVILSRGYGKQNRACAIIERVDIFDLIDFEPHFQERLRKLMRIELINNPEIIAVKMKNVYPVFYQNRVYYAVDPGAPGGDKNVETEYRVHPGGFIEFLNVKEKP